MRSTIPLCKGRGASTIAVMAVLWAASSVIAAPLKVDFRQGANNETNGTVQGLGNIHWINSIVQASNSVYFENMSVVQRTILTDIPATTGNVHTLTFFHENTKGGVHAYDFLTSYEQAITVALSAPYNFPVYELNPCGPEIANTLPGICNSLRTGPHSILVNVPDDPYISKDGSTQQRIDAYEAAYGNRTITIYGNQPFASASLEICRHTAAAGQDTGDSDLHYVLTWESTATNVLIEMAGHLAVSGDPSINPLAWGEGFGSAQINGGPYHFKLISLGGALSAGAPACTQTTVSSLGQQDNQVKGADILIPCPECMVEGPDPVCPESVEVYSVSVSGIAQDPTYSWSISGDGSIIGPADGASVSVEAASTCGSYELCVTLIADNCLDPGVTCCKTVTVSDETDPAATCPGPVSVQCPADVPAADASQVSCSDNCPAGATSSHVGDVSDGNICPEVITRTYKCTDTCANEGTCTQQITVDDTHLPVLSGCPTDIEVCEGEPISFTPPSCSDNCGPCTAVCTRSDGLDLADPYPIGTTTITCTATDDCGNDALPCVFDITVHRNPSCSIDDVCFEVDGARQNLCVTPAGGTAPYTFDWNNGDTTACITPADPGTYNATVTDADGCQSDACFGDILENPTCSMDLPVTGKLFTGSVSGGTTPYAASCTAVSDAADWTATDCDVDPATGAISVVYDPGQCPVSGLVTFTITVTDAEGCAHDCTVDVACPVQCAARLDPDEVCQEGDTVQFCLDVIAGLPPYTYTFTEPDGTETVVGPTNDTSACINVTAPLTAGIHIYSGQIVDGNDQVSPACPAPLTVNENPTCSIDPPLSEVCDGDPQMLCAQPSGGTGPYTYLWNTGATTQCITVTVGGNYSVVTTDAEGCEGSCEATFIVDACLCRVTGGGVDGLMPPDSWAEGFSGNYYTFGGQAGSPTASQPQPWGEWTHRQHRGPDGRFTFHGGTASHGESTEIDYIRCCDLGFCNPARFAPAKQINFGGVGLFTTISGNSPVAAVADKDTRHWFTVHIEDLGEPGNAAEDDVCPADGFTCAEASCGCADFYHITIHATTDPASSVIYEESGYIRGGNLQIHPPIE